MGEVGADGGEGARRGMNRSSSADHNRAKGVGGELTGGRDTSARAVSNSAPAKRLGGKGFATLREKGSLSASETRGARNRTGAESQPVYRDQTILD